MLKEELDLKQKLPSSIASIIVADFVTDLITANVLVATSAEAEPVEQAFASASEVLITEASSTTVAIDIVTASEQPSEDS